MLYEKARELNLIRDERHDLKCSKPFLEISPSSMRFFGE
ncbi:hypothetical protein SD77_1716 [Bacillus badius]|uniref:Uncharacterized protein n=1 Tax=Bacillus badius TaxID=1455 RepID=A0ABR5AQT1_BACBA|nr:hypothetical protein SD77_1716 [Bacillus badius]